MRKTFLVTSVVLSVGALAWVVWSTIVSSRQLSGGDLRDSVVTRVGPVDILASAERTDSLTWNVVGRVLTNGLFTEGATVWVVSRDELGNRASPGSVVTDAQGEFTIENVRLGTGRFQGRVVFEVYARLSGETALSSALPREV